MGGKGRRGAAGIEERVAKASCEPPGAEAEPCKYLEQV